MWLSRFAFRMLSISLMVLAAAAVSGQGYPNKPIRILAPGYGGSGDVAARLIARGLTGSLNQQVVVDNRGGVIPAEIVSKAPPDGYVLLVIGSGLWLTPLMEDNVPYDPVKDFSPITLASMSPNILVVHPSVPVKSVKELIALAKAKPGALNYAHTSGGSAQLAGELFKAMAGVKIVSVPYKAAGAALNDLISGYVQLMFTNVSSGGAHINSGRLRGLAVTSPQRTALMPGLPTVAASGLPGYESVAAQGALAPAGTPAALITRLNQEIVRDLNKVETKERFLNAGAEVIGSSPEQFSVTIKSEITRLAKVIKDAGIRGQ